MGKEALDDIKRNRRDKEVNSTRYEVLLPEAGGERGSLPSSALKVGDLVLLEKDQRVPADCVLLRTGEESGTCFVRYVNQLFWRYTLISYLPERINWMERRIGNCG